MRGQRVLYPPVRHQVPVLLATAGRRAIELAAREADAVAIGTRSAAELPDSLEWMRTAAGQRFPQIEQGMRLWVLPDGDERARQTAVAVLAGVGPDLDAMMAAEFRASSAARPRPWPSSSRSDAGGSASPTSSSTRA